eukprot:862158-Amphidinium_carterae.1
MGEPLKVTGCPGGWPHSTTRCCRPNECWRSRSGVRTVAGPVAGLLYGSAVGHKTSGENPKTHLRKQI